MKKITPLLQQNSLRDKGKISQDFWFIALSISSRFSSYKHTAEQKCLLYVLQIRLFFEDPQLFLQKSQLYRAPLTGGVAKTIRQNK